MPSFAVAVDEHYNKSDKEDDSKDDGSDGSPGKTIVIVVHTVSLEEGTISKLITAVVIAAIRLAVRIAAPHYYVKLLFSLDLLTTKRVLNHLIVIIKDHHRLFSWPYSCPFGVIV